ncbi:hypothetical protein [Nonomuraea jiangxiensis]|uniref:Uncharacterized protein n=1 Tax=Nonomuraea jiangxiensis TaxID=633440 RepID=A0A1G9P8X8_9ACTN|nr:hypothetical protein [Nonomuraea jiangxiensis]SDL95246.1 hypothetical protein SAMN05421869_13372 [Nonomuraea jiangxiensis]
MADPAKAGAPVMTDAAPSGPAPEARAPALGGPAADTLAAQRAAGNQAVGAAAQPPEPSGVAGFLANAVISMFVREFTGSGPQERIATAAIRGFVFTLVKEATWEAVKSGVKELAKDENMGEFRLGYKAGVILGFVSPVTDLFGILVLAEQTQRIAAEIGRAAWEHPDEVIAEANALTTQFRTFLTDVRTNLTAAELLKHLPELGAAAERAAAAAGSGAAHSVVLHFSGKEEERPMRPGAAAPAGPAAQLEHWATETRKKLTSTQWSRLGYNVGYDVGAAVSNTLLFVFGLGAGEAIAAIGAQLGRLGGLLARAGNVVRQLGEAIAAIEALIGALVSKPMKWLEPAMKPFFQLLERLRGFLRKLLGIAEKGAAKAAVTAVEKGAAGLAAAPPAAPGPPAAKPELKPKPRPRPKPPKTTPKAAPEVAPKTAPAVAPEAAPKAAPEVAPEGAPGTVPEPAVRKRVTAGAAQESPAHVPSAAEAHPAKRSRIAAEQQPEPVGVLEAEPATPLKKKSALTAPRPAATPPKPATPKTAKTAQAAPPTSVTATGPAAVTTPPPKAPVPPSGPVPAATGKGPSPEMVAAVEQGIKETPLSTVGAAGEAAALSSLRETRHEVFDLNKLRIDLHRVRKNFPLLDLISKGPAGKPGVVASVKNYAMGRTGELSPHTLRRYARDMKAMLRTGGPGYAPVPAEVAADLLAANRAQIQTAQAWPRDLAPDAGPERIARYINERSILVIPDDHVPQVRKFIGEQALRDPGAYELVPGPTLADDIARIQERVQPMGITSGQLHDIHRRVTKAP